jgi:hypothetical protein
MDQAVRDDLVHDHIQAMRARKLSGATQSRCKEAVVSNLAWNRQALVRPVKNRGVKLHPTLRDVQLPAQGKLRDVLAVASPDAAVATCLVAQAGTRPATIGNRQATDGLTYGDLQDAHFEGTELVFDQIPCLIYVRADISKNRMPYPTFLGPEGCHALQVSTRKRIEAGEKLGPKSALVRPRNLQRPFNSSPSISKLIRKAMRAAGVKEMPYILRSYFSNGCLLAERDGLGRDMKEFLMGHTGGLAVEYGLRKGAGGSHLRLSPKTKEQLRNGYTAALKYLETTAAIQTEDPRMGMVVLLLQAAGRTDDEIQALDLAHRAPSEIVDLLKSSFQDHAKPKTPKNTQEIVPLGNLADKIQAGWRFVANLGDGNAVVEQTA